MYATNANSTKGVDVSKSIAGHKPTTENASHLEALAASGSSPPDSALLVTLGIGLADAQDALGKPWRLKSARATIAACQGLILEALADSEDR